MTTGPTHDFVKGCSLHCVFYYCLKVASLKGSHFLARDFITLFYSDRGPGQGIKQGQGTWSESDPVLSGACTSLQSPLFGAHRGARIPRQDSQTGFPTRMSQQG